MKMISLAIASIVDANLNQGYTELYTGSSAELTNKQINRGRLIRSKSIFDFAGLIVGSLTGLIEKVSVRRQERQTIKQLIKLNDHMQKDIGLTEFDLLGIKSGALTLKDVERRRQVLLSESYTSSQTKRQKQFAPVRKSILELESANQDYHAFAKCS